MNAPARQCIICDHPGPFDEVFTTAGDRHTLVRCPRCRLVFQDPQPDEQALAASYYHDEQFAALLFGELREFTLSRAREKLGLLQGTGALQPGGRGLDVGCSSGAWLEVAAAQGMVMTGIELGEATASRARERGLDVRTGTLGELIGDLGRYDLITLWDVLEHVHDPRRELSLAAGLLAPGGVIAATMPNVEGWYPRLTYRLFARRSGMWEYPELPVHLHDFSPATARRLFARAGLRVRGVRTIATPFHFYRTTSLSLPRLGGGRRALARRAGFEVLHGLVYPAARLADRQNSLFIWASRLGGS